MKSLKAVLFTTLLLAANTFAAQEITTLTHSVLLGDNGIAYTKGTKAGSWLGHSQNDGEYHPAELRIDGRAGVQLVADDVAITQINASYLITAAQFENGRISIIGATYSISPGQINDVRTVSVVDGTDVKYTDFALLVTTRVVLLGNDGVVYLYKATDRSHTALDIQGIVSIEDPSVWSDPSLVVTAADGSTYSVDANGATVQLSEALEVPVVPTITDVQPGGSYLVSCIACGDIEGTVTMDGFVFDVISWQDAAVSIDRPLTAMTGELVVTSRDGLASNAYFATLEPAAPIEADCPVVEPEIIVEAVEVPGPTVYCVPNASNDDFVCSEELPVLSQPAPDPAPTICAAGQKYYKKHLKALERGKEVKAARFLTKAQKRCHDDDPRSGHGYGDKNHRHDKKQ